MGGVINPYPRARIEDLTAACMSMAETAIEAEDALRELRSELGVRV